LFLEDPHGTLFALARYARGRLALADFSPAEIACRRTGKLLVNESVLD
jgi:hypothetical protein